MPDTVVTPAAPDTQQAVTTSAAPDASATPVQGNPDADAARRALYEKHYGTSSAPAAPAQDTAMSTTPAAQAGTSTGAPASVGAPPEWAVALQQELARLQELMKPATAVQTSAPAADAEPGWITLLREGKVKEAEEALAASVAQKVQAPMVDTAVARAREIARAENEISSFVTEVRTVNPELAPLERLVAAEAQERLAAVQAAGKIKSTDDAIREYKKAVLDATESVRKTYQTIRGAGKTEAQVRSREILSASTLSPQQVDTNRQQVNDNQTQAQEPESVESYLEKRRNAETARKGMAV